MIDERSSLFIRISLFQLEKKRTEGLEFIVVILQKVNFIVERIVDTSLLV